MVAGKPLVTTLCSLMLPSEAQSSWLMVEVWLSKALCSVAGCKKAGNTPSLDSYPLQLIFYKEIETIALQINELRFIQFNVVREQGGPVMSNGS